MKNILRKIFGKSSVAVASVDPGPLASDDPGPIEIGPVRRQKGSKTSSMLPSPISGPDDPGPIEMGPVWHF